VIPEGFLPFRATREDLLVCCWQAREAGLCILFSHSKRAVPGPCVYLKSTQEVGVIRSSLLNGFQGSGSMG
jgi:hypothetical protein